MAATTKRDVQSTLSQARKALRKAPEEMTDTLKEVVSDVRDQAQEFVEAGRERVSQWNDIAQESLRSRPFRTLLVGVGIGCLLGLLLRRR